MDVDALEALEQAATPGPWEAFYDDYDRGTWLVSQVDENGLIHEDHRIPVSDATPEDAALIVAELPDDGVIVSAELAAFAGAWDAVQKALPDYIAALAAKSGDEPWVGRWSPALSGANGHYVAWVVDTEEGWVDDTSHYADAIGPTPTAALVALRKTLEAAK